MFQLFPGVGIHLLIAIYKRIELVIFQGGGGVRTPCPLSGSAHDIVNCSSTHRLGHNTHSIDASYVGAEVQNLRRGSTV